MKNRIILFIIAAAFMVANGWMVSAAEFGTVPARAFYTYEKEYPLKATEKLFKETPLYRVYDVEYSGAWGSRVPAYLMLPAGEGAPFPCIIFGHGFTGNRDDIAFAYEDFAKRGYAVLSIDFWYHGLRKVQGVEMYSPNLLRMRDGLVASAIDLSRGLDYLEGKKEIDAGKIGYAGGSMGGIIGALFAGSDERVKAPVLIVGGADWSFLISKSVVSSVVLSSNPLEIARFSKRAKTELAPADPLYLIGNIAPRPLLMINSKYDMLVPPTAAKRMFSLAGEPKKEVWFDSGHEVPKDKVIPLAADWADKYVKRNDVPDFTRVVEGYETAPIKIEDDRNGDVAPELPVENLFAYNREVPLLSDSLKGDSDIAGAEMFLIHYSSSHDRKVSGKLYIPIAGEGKPGCVIMVHDAGGAAEDFSYMAHLLARNGVASAVIDTMMFNDETEASEPFGVAGLENRIAQTVVDVRRLMDLLDKVAEVQNGKYAIMGEGAGGMAAAIVSALDERAAITIASNAGGGFDKEQIPAAMFRGGARTDDKSRAIELMIDPARYLARGRKAPFMAIRDASGSMFSRESARAMIEASGSNNKYVEIEETEKAKIARLMKGALVFLRDNWIVEEKESPESGSKVIPLEAPSNSWAGINMNEGASGGLRTRVVRLSKKSSADGYATIVAQAELGGLVMGAPEKRGAETVTAYAAGGSAGFAAALLRDDGKKDDREAGDGIFTGAIKIPDSGDILVCVGGVGGGGESIEEKCEKIGK